LAKRQRIEMKSSLLGKAFENYIFHELNAYRSYKCPSLEISYWALTTQVEVDFILNHMEAALEIKSTDQVKSNHLKGLIELEKDHPDVKQRIVISLDPKTRSSSEGIRIMFYKDFLKELWEGKIIPSQI